MKKKSSDNPSQQSDPPKKITHRSGAPMVLDTRHVLIEFKASQKKETLDKKARTSGLKMMQTEKKQLVKRAWFSNSKKTPGPQGKQDVEKKLGKKIQWVAPVYRIGKGKQASLVSPLPHVLLIRDFAEREDEDAINDAITRFGLTLDEKKTLYLAPFHYYTLQDDTKNVYSIRDELIKEFDLDVRFEIMPMKKPTTFVPNDTLFANQWNIDIIHAGDISLEGWDITTGNENVIIAILDEGVDLGHPDLNFASNGINLGSMSGNGSPTGNHGTACAGIAAASINNNLGIAGVAGSCLLLPIAFQHWTDAEVAAGIRYATDHGAHVISMSFGQYAPEDNMAPSGWDFDVINPAIEYAIENGVTLVAATGNENINTINRYPARHDLVIAVGASDQADNRKSPSSPDGEGWGSNFGPGVSVVAPGVRIPTTDRRGNAGYVTGDYTLRFNGTSSATPHVAGLAGLIKSVCPTENPTDIRNILERTCDKVGASPYNNSSDNGTTNRPMGHGRINVSEAVKEGFLHLVSCII